MDQELQDKLFKKYPRLFKQKDWSIQDSCMPWGIETGNGWYDIIDVMCKIIHDHVKGERENRARALVYNRALSRALKGDLSYLESHYKRMGYKDQELEYTVNQETGKAAYRKVTGLRGNKPQFQFTQIKEKYGTLRVYYTARIAEDDDRDAFFHGVIHTAEAMSARICETCGQPGKIRGGYWLYTACDQHTNDKDKD